MSPRMREFLMDVARRSLDRLEPADRAAVLREAAATDPRGQRTWRGLRPTGDAGRANLVAARLNLHS